MILDHSRSNENAHWIQFFFEKFISNGTTKVGTIGASYLLKFYVAWLIYLWLYFYIFVFPLKHYTVVHSYASRKILFLVVYFFVLRFLQTILSDLVII
jgi:hypothetical protein